MTPATKSFDPGASLTLLVMASRLRLIFTALLIGGAVLVMHVEMSGPPADGHHSSAHVDHSNCPDPSHCQDEPHQNHWLMACSMVLLALGGTMLVRRVASSRVVEAVAAVTRRSIAGQPFSAPFKPPDLTVLSVMRC